MSRYIDADALMLQVAKKKPEVAKARWTEGFNEAILKVRSMIHSAPTADVVEVRHGYWKWERKIEPQAQNRLYCSICDIECLSKGNYYVYSTYCPNCGAKMDGDRREQ